MSASEPIVDRTLVQLCVHGDKAAFEQLVQRYVGAVSATAYAMTGNQCTSDDVTQQTFLTAWQRIRQLEDPEKIRAWLCAIARNIVRGIMRNQHGDPLHGAQNLEVQLVSPAARPDEQALANERQRVVWSAIRNIPEDYRIPLVMYYRENRSTREVAEALELTEEAVRQRLSRARGMLKRDIASLVEDSLSSSAPSALLVGSIVAAISGGASQASAAALFAGAAKASGTGIISTGAGIAASALGPVVGIAGGLYGAYMSMKNARSDEERRILKRLLPQCIALVSVWVIAVGAIGVSASLGLLTFTQTLILGSINLIVYLVLLVWLITRANRQIAAHQAITGTSYVLEKQTFADFARQSPRQWRNSMISSFGGAVFGSVGWLVAVSVISGDWSRFSATLLFAALTTGVAVFLSIRRPQDYWLHGSFTALALLVFTYMAAPIQWPPELAETLRRQGGVGKMPAHVIKFIAEALLLFFAVGAAYLHRRSKRAESWPRIRY